MDETKKMDNNMIYYSSSDGNDGQTSESDEDNPKTSKTKEGQVQTKLMVQYCKRLSIALMIMKTTTVDPNQSKEETSFVVAQLLFRKVAVLTSACGGFAILTCATF